MSDYHVSVFACMLTKCKWEWRALSMKSREERPGLSCSSWTTDVGGAVVEVIRIPICTGRDIALKSLWVCPRKGFRARSLPVPLGCRLKGCRQLYKEFDPGEGYNYIIIPLIIYMYVYKSGLLVFWRPSFRSDICKLLLARLSLIGLATLSKR